MMEKKQLIPCVWLFQEQAVKGFQNTEELTALSPQELTKLYQNAGADALLIFDLSKGDAEHDRALTTIRHMADVAELALIGAGNIQRLEDVKKLVYAGCSHAVLNFAKESNRALLKEASERFGKEKLAVYLPEFPKLRETQAQIEEFASLILCPQGLEEPLRERFSIPMLVYTEEAEPAHWFAVHQKADAMTGSGISLPDMDFMQAKRACQEAGIAVHTLESSMDWASFHPNADGLLPVIVQDYQTDEVLMLAYMNQEAFTKTLQTGKMTYWSRSRKQLWTKGETSGHFQYVKSLAIDCDEDTLLAKVSQTGAACHTGNKSCFYRNLVKKDYDDTNPLRVFQDVFAIICDRKDNPKEGSYTNYLFTKGIDKILKKVGEEATEIVIAAKNPDKEEIKYEIADFLYHVMVLMAECGVSWEEITKELSRR